MKQMKFLHLCSFFRVGAYLTKGIFLHACFAGIVDRDGISTVRAALQAGLVPVLHGDVVLDGVQGVSILSGDTILERLAFHFHPQRAVFLTNVMGVFDRPPELEGAVMLREIVTENGGEWHVLR